MMRFVSIGCERQCLHAGVSRRLYFFGVVLGKPVMVHEEAAEGAGVLDFFPRVDSLSVSRDPWKPVKVPRFISDVSRIPSPEQYFRNAFSVFV